MTSTFLGLEIAKRALYAQQSALSTTAQNVANANTDGYTRQRAEMQATTPLPNAGMNVDKTPGQMGTGVEVTKLVRLRDDYLDVQYRGQNKDLGYYDAKSDTLSKMEELLNEPSDNGLAETMDSFFNSWQELQKEPDSASNRAVVAQSGTAVAETFNYISDSLDQMQGDLKNVITSKVDEVNSLAKQIGSLNDQISRLVPNNYEPNDLYDQRDLLIDQLSNLTGVNVIKHQDTGMVDITVGTEYLVQGKNAKSLSVGYDSDGLVDPSQTKIDGNTVTLDSGELLGRMESYGIEGSDSGASIPNLRAKINDLAMTFANKVNEVQESGLNLENLNGSGTASPAFFTGTSIKDLSVNSDIMNNLNLIAAAKEESPGVSSSGNGENAKAMAAIKSTSLGFATATTTTNDNYQNIIAQLGIDSQESQRMSDNTNVIVQQVDNRRQSVSGVSLDEEMANMIKFQQSYNAAARAVTVMDECLDKVINGMGRTGL